MKISSNNYFINFGYDKELNNELKQRLKNYPDKKWASTISSMNSQCNKLEGYIRTEDKKKKKDQSKINDYFDIFIEVKKKLAGLISITFDDLNYADREYLHYFDDFVKSGAQENSWQQKTWQALSEWTSFIHLNSTDGKTDNESKEEKEEVTMENVSQRISNLASKLPQKKFIVEYVPTSKSPKGFCDVAGMDELKEDFYDDIISYIKNPEIAELDLVEYGREIPKGILLFGPPGCGKTHIVKALSAESKIPLYILNISNAGSSYINMTSKNIQSAFDEAAKIAEESGKPCLLFMDEVDTFAFDRNSRTDNEDLKQVGTLLQAIDSVKDKNVIIIGATNKYNLIDAAILRRFDKHSPVDVPDREARLALLKLNLSKALKGNNLLSSPDDLEQVIQLLEGFSSDSICIISKKALDIARKRNRDNVSVNDYKIAIEKTGQEKPDRSLYFPKESTRKKIGF